MGLIDILTGGVGKALSRKKLDRLLHQISALSPQEREYINGIFARFLSNGISKQEAQKAIHQLKLNIGDSIDPAELEKIKLKILSFFV
ncbi:MAG: hypothetical protein QMD50_01765 [Patescibacteria group bacterium]|nr:hypothetical protein [Patescibacteria group bacterium]